MHSNLQIIRLLANHPHFCNTVMTADRKDGQSMSSVFPHLIKQDAYFCNVDDVFCCLPHGTTQVFISYINLSCCVLREMIKGLPKNLKIVDLFADFRLRNIDEYQEWYGQPHNAPDLQKEAVYGLTEIYRKEIRNARLVANPGRYPTTIQLPLIPLMKVCINLFCLALSNLYFVSWCMGDTYLVN
ncbi:hypothetical protein MKW92_051111 [Papaver armeniacum]|nr:hypothetical protein MKW92_051111 [Papaver armeniacum]